MAKQATNTKSLFPVNHVTDPSADFVKALQEDSNQEADWLFWAARMTTREEQLYCLERARYINPSSTEAANGIRHLSRAAHQPSRPTPIARFRWMVSRGREA